MVVIVSLIEGLYRSYVPSSGQWALYPDALGMESVNEEKDKTKRNINLISFVYKSKSWLFYIVLLELNRKIHEKLHIHLKYNFSFGIKYPLLDSVEIDEKPYFFWK